MCTNKVYGDAPNRIALQRTADALGLRRPGLRARHRRELSPSTSRKHSLFGASQGRRRRDGAGVRPLFRHADLLPARRLPDRAEPLRRRAARVSSATWSSATSKAGNTGSSATRASRCATTSIRSTWPASCTRSVEAPRAGEVYNLGGGKDNSCSILEAFAARGEVHRQAAESTPTSRRTASGDHICYYSDLRKMRAHYPALGHHRSRWRKRSARSSPRGGSARPPPPPPRRHLFPT